MVEKPMVSVLVPKIRFVIFFFRSGISDCVSWFAFGLISIVVNVFSVLVMLGVCCAIKDFVFSLSRSVFLISFDWVSLLNYFLERVFLSVLISVFSERIGWRFLVYFLFFLRILLCRIGAVDSKNELVLISLVFWFSNCVSVFV